MEAAAKTIQLLTQRILPEKPHHLCPSTDWRCRVPPDDAASKYFEEWENTRLQYTTLVSEADRGVLFTRSSYDMRVEPPKPVPRDVNALAKPAGEKKKLSLSDYKNKKTGIASSDSTPDPVAKRREPAPTTDPRPMPENKRPDGHRPRENQPAADGRPPKIREPAVDMRLPPKPPSLPPRPPSPDSRKRGPDVDDDVRAQKRLRPDLGRPPDDRSRTPRDEPPRRRDREPHPSQDRTPQRDGKHPVSSAASNGRGILKAATGANQTISPAGRARGTSVNGARASLAASSKSASAKPDSSKKSVPPLLSPLHLSFNGREGDAPEKGEKKRPREDGVESARPTKARKPDPPPASKRDKSPVHLPTLLSPTLPPIVEAGLLKRKDSSKAAESRPRETTARKAPVEQDDEDSDTIVSERPKRLLVTLKIPKRLRQTVKRILALAPRKEPQHERSANSDAASSQAKKRPAGASSEIVIDSISVKRPRPSDASLAKPPQTPSKKSSTMSRVNSNNSQVYTPGDLTTVTPSAPGSSERTVNGTEPSRADRAESHALSERHKRLSTLGKRLKHSGDVAINPPVPATNGAGSRNSDSTGNPKLGYVLTLESILAFMASFYALNQSRSLSNKVSDTASWESLFPLIEHLQVHLRRADPRRHQPLNALILLLNAVTIEELSRCHATFENPVQQVRPNDLVRTLRMRARAWQLAGEAIEAIESPSLRVVVTPWSTINEVADSALRVLKRWCSEYRVDWTPELNPNERG